MTEGASPGVTPWLNVTPGVALRVSASTAFIAVGMYYLISGRQQASLDRMITGAALCLLSTLVFAL